MSVSVCPECLSHGVPLKCVYLETPGEQNPSQSNALGHRRPRVQPLPRVMSPAVYRPILDPRRPLSPEPDPRIFSSTSTPRLLTQLTVLTSRVIRHNYRSARFAK